MPKTPKISLRAHGRPEIWSITRIIFVITHIG
jgi:hypothetical protein